jgi:hypothetical protein
MEDEKMFFGSRVRKFTSIDTFEITGRGTVYTGVYDEEECPFSEIEGKTIIMDGKFGRCTGIEKMGNRDSIQKGESFGIIFKEH